jgi:membrane-associated phospholipid phosphatase
VVSIDRSSRRSLITATLLLAACLIGTAAILPWDYELSHGIRSVRIPGDFRKFIVLTEIFAHSMGCTLILGTLLWIDDRNRPKLLYGTGFVLLCGLSSNALKYIIPRKRPYVYDNSDCASLTSSWDTWGAPFTESWFDETLRSFPSGHTATAVAMAIALSYVYPKGKALFFFMAFLASLQRILAGAHYTSDVLASICLTIVLALLWARVTRELRLRGA